MDGLLQLSNVDITYLSDIGADLVLSPEEKQLLDVLKEYEKRSREKKDVEEVENIEGDRSEGKNQFESIFWHFWDVLTFLVKPESIKIGSFDTRNLGMKYLYTVFGGIVLAFALSEFSDVGG